MSLEWQKWVRFPGPSSLCPVCHRQLNYTQFLRLYITIVACSEHQCSCYSNLQKDKKWNPISLRSLFTLRRVINSLKSQGFFWVPCQWMEFNCSCALPTWEVYKRKKKWVFREHQWTQFLFFTLPASCLLCSEGIFGGGKGWGIGMRVVGREYVYNLVALLLTK